MQDDKAPGEENTRNRIDQSLNIAGSVLEAAGELNAVLRDDELAKELGLALDAVGRARDIVIREPAQSYRFRIDWWTTILDRDDAENLLGRYPIRGYTIVLAEDMDGAKDIAESLCDVDFFVPGKDYSASSPEVVGGVMWQERSDLKDWDAPAPTTATYLGDILDVEEWNFDEVKILDVREVTE